MAGILAAGALQAATANSRLPQHMGATTGEHKPTLTLQLVTSHEFAAKPPVRDLHKPWP